MKRHDRTTVTTTRDQRAAALRAGVDATRHTRAHVNLPWPPDDLSVLLARMGETAEGSHAWQAGRSGRAQVPRVEVYWASDYAGRRHLRVVADRRSPSDSFPLLGYASGMPAAWQVFRERAWLWHRPDGGAEVVCVCDCGAAGTVAEIAWMGAMCGPCHDRTESGVPVPRPFARPTLPAPPGLAYVPVLATTDGRGVVATDGILLFWCDLTVGEWRTLPEEGVGLAIHPDGRRVLFVSTDSQQVRLWDAETGTTADVLPSGQQLYSVDFDRAGRTLAGLFFPARHLAVWDWPGMRLRWSEPLGVELAALRLSPDGGTLALADSRGVRVVPLATYTAAPAVPPATSPEVEPGGAAALAFAPDGRRLAAFHSQPCVSVFDLESGSVAGTDVSGTGPRRWPDLRLPGVAFVDHETLLVWDESGYVHVLDASEATLRATLEWTPMRISYASFTLVGEWLVGTIDGQLRFWPWRPLVEYARRRAGP